MESVNDSTTSLALRVPRLCRLQIARAEAIADVCKNARKCGIMKTDNSPLPAPVAPSFQLMCSHHS